MGVKAPLLTLNDLPLKIQIDRAIYLTVVIDYGSPINLNEIANEYFEPEIFPALILKRFSPINVNVSASGKIVCTGVKSTDCRKLVSDIINHINNVYTN